MKYFKVMQSRAALLSDQFAKISRNFINFVVKNNAMIDFDLMVLKHWSKVASAYTFTLLNRRY